MKKLFSLVLVALLIATASFTYASASYDQLPDGKNYLDFANLEFDGASILLIDPITVIPNTTYTFSYLESIEGSEISIYGNDSLAIEVSADEVGGTWIGVTFTTNASTNQINYIEIYGGTVVQEVDYYGLAAIELQLEVGSTATTREAYVAPAPDIVAPIINGGTGVWLTNVDSPDTVATMLASMSASDDNDGSIPVTVHSDLYTGNEGTLGDYNVVFRATDSSGNYTEVVTIVRVVDVVAPIVNLTGPSSIDVEFGTTYSEPGATVSDNYDTGLSAAITGSVNNIALGTYNLNYDSIDSSGNIATTVTRSVNVVDTLAPAINLTGPSSIDVEFGDNYTEQGATWTDAFDGSGAAIPSGSVNVGVLGTYTVSYNITDSNGNIAITVTRTVNVVDTTNPAFSGLTTYNWNISLYNDLNDLLSLITATDLFDGDLTGSITVITDTFSPNRTSLGTYNILLRVTDSSGNSSDYSITINLIDDIAPTFTTTATLLTLEYANSMSQQDIVDYFGG